MTSSAYRQSLDGCRGNTLTDLVTDGLQGPGLLLFNISKREGMFHGLHKPPVAGSSLQDAESPPRVEPFAYSLNGMKKGVGSLQNPQNPRFSSLVLFKGEVRAAINLFSGTHGISVGFCSTNNVASFSGTRVAPMLGDAAKLLFTCLGGSRLFDGI